jgi:hypothetical protein
VIGEQIRTIYAVAPDVNRDGRMDVIAARYHPGLIYRLEQLKDALHDKWAHHVIDDAADGGATVSCMLPWRREWQRSPRRC